jgi:hypothetical protein
MEACWQTSERGREVWIKSSRNKKPFSNGRTPRSGILGLEARRPIYLMCVERLFSAALRLRRVGAPPHGHRRATCIERLKKAGMQFRNETEVGPGGEQIQMEDADGNPIALFEPTK